MDSVKNGKKLWRHFGSIVVAIITLLLSNLNTSGSAEASVPAGIRVSTVATASMLTNAITPTGFFEVISDLTQPYPKPILVYPSSGATVGKKTIFSWQWNGTLQQGDRFDLRIGRADVECSCIALCDELNYRLDSPLHGPGQYSWQVAVVRIGKDNTATTLSESPTQSFVWSNDDKPMPEAVVVREGGLNLRSGPGVIYDIADSLLNGEALDIQGRTVTSRWIKIASIDRDIEGWVSALPEHVQIVNVDLDANIPVVESPPTPTPIPTQVITPTQAPLPTALAPAPGLLLPKAGTTSYRNRSDLSWEWAGTLGPNDYFQVEIRNRINVFDKFDESVLPIDRAWVKEKFYRYDVVEENYPDEYKWRIIVVRGTPPGEKQWSTPEHRVWEPSSQLELISEPSELRQLFVKPGDEPASSPDGGGGSRGICHDEYGQEIPC